MKRVSLIIGLIFILFELIFTGCGKTIPEYTGRGEDVTENETSATQTPKNTATPTSTPVPTDTPTPTPSPAPIITVDDALVEAVERYHEVVLYRIPEVNISTVDTTEANETIFNEFKDHYYYHYSERSGDFYGFIVDYEYSISDNFVSVLLSFSAIEYDYWGFKVYNISIEDGSIVSGEEFLKKIGKDDDEFFDDVRETYVNWWEANYSYLNGEYSYMNENNISKVSFENVEPYLSSDGHLCFVGYVECIGGADRSLVCFDADEKQGRRRDNKI